MHDRNEYDLRFAEHYRRVEAMNDHAWKRNTPVAASRSALATFLRALAARLEPSATPVRSETQSSISTLS